MARAHRGDGGRIAVRIHLCGELAVEWDGESLAPRLPGRQGRILFAYLVLHRARPVRRDELEEVLEGSSLAPPLSRLRKALGEGRLEGRSELRLALPEDAWIDWEVAHHGVERARAAMRMRAWADAWGPAGAARAIAERGLLPGLEAPWLDPLRASLADLRIEALEALARTGVRAGRRGARPGGPRRPRRDRGGPVPRVGLRRADGRAARGGQRRGGPARLRAAADGAARGARRVARAGPRREARGAAARRAGTRSPLAMPGTRPHSRRCGIGLVERDAEVATLAGLLRRASSGDGGVVVVEGAAGVGKTGCSPSCARSPRRVGRAC